MIEQLIDNSLEFTVENQSQKKNQKNRKSSLELIDNSLELKDKVKRKKLLTFNFKL